jgi:hypothetical protein
MNPVEKLIYKAMERKGLSKAELVKKAGCFNETNCLSMLEALLSGSNLVGFRHTPIRRIPEVLDIPQDKFDDVVAKFAEIIRIAEEDWAAARGIYNERTFKPHLWLRTSQQTPQPIFIVALYGEAMFKHVPLPEGVITGGGAVLERVAEVIRDHYRRSNGRAQIFGDIVSYILKLSYDDPGIEFSPEGQIISNEPLLLPQGKATLSLDNKNIPPEILDKLVESITSEIIDSIERIEITFKINKGYDT